MVCVGDYIRQDAANGVAAADGSNLAAVGAGVVHEPIQGLPFMEDGACEVRATRFFCHVRTYVQQYCSLCVCVLLLCD